MSDGGRELARTVVGVWRAVRLARLGEAVLLGAAALGLTLAAAVVSLPRGAPERWPHALGAALVCALACTLTWWLEHRPSPADVAARMDRKLRLGGALVTAFELDRAGAAPSGIAALLVARVRRRATRQDGLRVALPRSGPFLAPPLLAAALLAAALEAHRAPEEGTPALALFAGLAGHAAELGERAGRDLAAGALTPEEARAALELAARAGRLELRAREAPEPGSPEAAELAAEAARLDAELQGLLRELPPESGTARAAERAAAWADLAGGMGKGTAGGAASPTGSPDGPDSTGQENPEVADAAPHGTMSGSERLPTSAADASDGSPDPGGAAGTPEAERGVAAVRWWPERYDGVVERWVEARRDRLRSEPR